MLSNLGKLAVALMLSAGAAAPAASDLTTTIDVTTFDGELTVTNSLLTSGAAATSSAPAVVTSSVPVAATSSAAVESSAVVTSVVIVSSAPPAVSTVVVSSPAASSVAPVATSTVVATSGVASGVGGVGAPGVSTTVASGSAVATSSASASASSTGNVTAVNITQVIQEEILAPNQVDRIEDVAATDGNASFVFDFANPPVAAQSQFSGGNITQATQSTFPALVDTSISLVFFQLGPCGVVLPHTHPRASEFVVLNDGQLVTQFLTETGSEVFTNTLNPLQGTVFPQGSLHTEINPTCNNISFFGALPSSDPGAFFVPSQVFGFQENIVETVLGGVVNNTQLEKIRAAAPLGVAVVEQCLQSCGFSSNSTTSSAPASTATST